MSMRHQHQEYQAWKMYLTFKGNLSNVIITMTPKRWWMKKYLVQPMQCLPWRLFASSANPLCDQPCRGQTFIFNKTKSNQICKFKFLRHKEKDPVPTLPLSGVLADKTNTSTYWAVCDGSLGPSPQNHQHFNFLGNNHLILTAVSIKLCSHCLFEVSSGIDRWFGGIVGNQEDVHHISHLGPSEPSGSEYRCMCTVQQIKDWAADPESILTKAEVTP